MSRASFITMVQRSEGPGEMSRASFAIWVQHSGGPGDMSRASFGEESAQSCGMSIDTAGPARAWVPQDNGEKYRRFSLWKVRRGRRREYKRPKRFWDGLPVRLWFRSWSFAPSPSTTDGKAEHPGPGGTTRTRRRGPRSFTAREARHFKWRQQKHACTNEARKESSILQVNMRGWISNVAALTAQLVMMTVLPDVVAITETHLDKSTESICLENYLLVCRRDRQTCEKGGGVALFVKESISKQITALGNSQEDERIWALLHSNQGALFVGCWYRPPHQGEVDSIERFAEEVEDRSVAAMGTIVVGDMNVHNASWLVHSNGSSAEGRRLYDVCSVKNFRQCVREPTRNEYLLDLVLTEIGACKCNVLPNVSDHNMVLATLQQEICKNVSFTRKVWHYDRADWRNSKSS